MNDVRVSDVQQSESIVELAQAYVQAWAEMNAAMENSVNPKMQYRYADMGAVLAAVKPALLKNGLAIMQFVSAPQPLPSEKYFDAITPTPPGDKEAARLAVDESFSHASRIASVSITTMLIHTSGQYIRSTVAMPLYRMAGLTPVQVFGLITTYLRRYAITALTCIYAGEDNDGSDNEHAGSDSNPGTSRPGWGQQAVEAVRVVSMPKPNAWTTNSAMVEKVTARFEALGLLGKIHEVLGVEQITDYPGSLEDIAKAIETYQKSQGGQ